MNSGQKVIVCVAIGAVMVVLGFAARAWWWETPGRGGGWINYAPNNGVMYTFDGPDGQSILNQAAIWIGLVVMWAAACLFVLRTKGDTGGKAPSTPDS
jgi:hypothetical protein